MGKNIIVMKMFKLQKWKPTLLQVLPSNITTFLKKEWKKILSQVTSLDFKCHDIVVKEAVHKWRQQFFVKLWNPCRPPCLLHVTAFINVLSISPLKFWPPSPSKKDMYAIYGQRLSSTLFFYVFLWLMPSLGVRTVRSPWLQHKGGVSKYLKKVPTPFMDSP